MRALVLISALAAASVASLSVVQSQLSTFCRTDAYCNEVILTRRRVAVSINDTDTETPLPSTARPTTDAGWCTPDSSEVCPPKLCAGEYGNQKCVSVVACDLGPTGYCLAPDEICPTSSQGETWNGPTLCNPGSSCNQYCPPPTLDRPCINVCTTTEDTTPPPTTPVPTTTTPEPTTTTPVPTTTTPVPTTTTPEPTTTTPVPTTTIPVPTTPEPTTTTPVPTTTPEPTTTTPEPTTTTPEPTTTTEVPDTSTPVPTTTTPGPTTSVEPNTTTSVPSTPSEPTSIPTIQPNTTAPPVPTTSTTIPTTITPQPTTVGTTAPPTLAPTISGPTSPLPTTTAPPSTPTGITAGPTVTTPTVPVATSVTPVEPSATPTAAPTGTDVLDLRGKGLASIPTIPEGVVVLLLDNNLITSCRDTVFPVSLKVLSLRDNLLSDLNCYFPPYLEKLFVSRNRILTLEITIRGLIRRGLADNSGYTGGYPNTLIELEADGNRLVSLEKALFPTSLHRLDVSSNTITNLGGGALSSGGRGGGVSSAKGLRELNAAKNKLASLDETYFPSSLRSLNVNENQLTSLDATKFPTGLEKLISAKNGLRSLQGVNWPTDLQSLDVSYNSLQSLNCAKGYPDGLRSLKAAGNAISSLQGTRLPTSSLDQLDVSKNKPLSCLPADFVAAAKATLELLISGTNIKCAPPKFLKTDLPQCPSSNLNEWQCGAEGGNGKGSSNGSSSPSSPLSSSSSSPSSSASSSVTNSSPPNCSSGELPVSVVGRGIFCAAVPICSGLPNSGAIKPNCPTAQAGITGGSECTVISTGVLGCVALPDGSVASEPPSSSTGGSTGPGEVPGEGTYLMPKCSSGYTQVSVEGIAKAFCAKDQICTGGFPNGNCPVPQAALIRGSRCTQVKTGVHGCVPN